MSRRIVEQNIVSMTLSKPSEVSIPHSKLPRLRILPSLPSGNYLRPGLYVMHSTAHVRINSSITRFRK